MRLLLSITVLAGAVAAAPVHAQQYPARAIRVYIPFTAASAADIIMRAMEPQMREKLGQSFIIDNRGGAGGNIAAELTAKSAPDGYTVMMGTIGTHAINYSLYSKLPYHPQRDFAPVALVGESPNILVINPYVPAKSIRELIALVKAGRLRAFAVTGEKRSPSIPELPTVSEAALPGYAASAWFGLLGPAGMPPAAVTALSTAALAALQTQEVKDRLFASGVEIRPMPPDEFARLIDSEIKKWAQVVKASGAKVD